MPVQKDENNNDTTANSREAIKEELKAVLKNRVQAKKDAAELLDAENEVDAEDKPKINITNKYDDDPNPYPMIYSIYCLSLLAFSTTTSFWTRSAMASFYGYGVGGKLNDPFYAMQKDDIGLDSKSYA